jgi:hypothetical protein
MIVTYKHDPVFVHSFNYALGGLRRNLDELKEQNLLLGDVAALREAGYEYNFALRSDETLLQLASRPVLETGQMSDGIDAMVFQHCYQESAVLPYAPNEPDVALRNRYFAAEVMRELKLDHLPYLCSFASGCAGFASILLTAAGLFDSSRARSTICVMADSMPPGVPFNMLRERILQSDQSSAFRLGRERRGYRLLGINFYSTVRTAVPFVEIVRRAVEMIDALAAELQLEMTQSDVALHYPNMFPDTWRIPDTYRCRGVSIMENIRSGPLHITDSVVTLKITIGAGKGESRIMLWNRHLGVCILREEAHRDLESDWRLHHLDSVQQP